MTLHVVWDRFTHVAAVAEASFLTTGDRQFGPRLFTSGGARWYVLDRGAGPFVGTSWWRGAGSPGPPRRR